MLKLNTFDWCVFLWSNRYDQQMGRVQALGHPIRAIAKCLPVKTQIIKPLLEKSKSFRTVFL
jgi:hypothetical protein